MTKEDEQTKVIDFSTFKMLESDFEEDYSMDIKQCDCGSVTFHLVDLVVTCEFCGEEYGVF